MRKKLIMNLLKVCSVLLVFLMVSCIPAKDLIYLRDNGTQKNESAITPVASQPYRLQTNDLLQITVRATDMKLVEVFNTTPANQALQNENTVYYMGYVVDDHGNIRMPILNEINVLGFTVAEVREKIEKRLLDEYFKEEAGIFVNVKLGGFRYTINGEVMQPGTKILLVEKLNIMEAIANAGDITVTGNRKEVQIIRQAPHGTEIHTIDLTDVNAMKSPYFYLQPNDYIYIKPLPQKVWGTGTTGMQTVTTALSALTLMATAILIFIR